MGTLSIVLNFKNSRFIEGKKFYILLLQYFRPILYEVEKIVDKRINPFGLIEYEVKWKDWPSEDNTWENVNNLQNCKSLIEEYEQSCMEEFLKNRFPEIPSPNGFERGLIAKKIEGMTPINKKIYVLVAWKGNNGKELVPFEKARYEIPQVSFIK